MSIAIADWPHFGRRHASTADAVATKLSSLASRDTRVFGDLSLGAEGRPLDFVVISPASVFTVRIEESDGSDIHVNNYGMTVDGTGVPCLRQAKFDAERAARFLGQRVGFDFPVRGCVVVASGGHAPQIVFENRPIGVSVLTPHDVPRWFRGHPAVLSPAEVSELWDAASAA